MKSNSDKLYDFFIGLLSDEGSKFESDSLKLTLNEIHLISKIDPVEKVTISELASRLNLKLSSTSIAVDNLIKKGYLNRSRCETDRRKVFISVSEAGVEIFNRHKEFHTYRMKKLTKNVSKNELKHFFEILEKMNENLKFKDNKKCGNCLHDFDEGSDIIVSHIEGKVGKVNKLAELGIFPDTEIKIIRKQTRGPLILNVKGSRISIGRKIAGSIFGCKKE